VGLLDDAIREHLELKRRRGADPSEVARQEHEALGPARRSAPPGEDDAEAPLTEGEDEGAVALSRMPEDDADADGDDGLDDEPHFAVPFEPVPDEPGAELRPAAGTPPPDGGRGDVLEDTPEFLEEAPEHDRLWFEQRPPRDFDF
jgi:hypothetical protein